MIDDNIFLPVLAAMWVVGSAIGLGVYQALKSRTSKYEHFGYIWAMVFSWAFVGWMAAGHVNQSLKALVLNIQRCAVHRLKKSI